MSPTRRGIRRRRSGAVRNGAVFAAALAAVVVVLSGITFGSRLVGHVLSRALLPGSSAAVRSTPATPPARHTGTLPAAPVARAPRAAASPAPVPVTAGDWPTYGGGQGNGFAMPQRPPGQGGGLLLKLAWYAKVGGEVSGNPVAVGRQVFFGTYAGTVYALARDTGRTLWTARLDGSPVDGGALYDGGRLFVATSGGRVYALDPRDGRVLWASASLLGGLKDALRASPRAYGGVLYESLGGTDDDLHEQGGVVALDEATGRVLWRTMLVNYDGGGAAVFGPPAVLPRLGELVVGTGNPTPYPTDAAAPGSVPAGPDPYSDSLVALSLADGHILWAAQTHPHDASDADFIAAPNVVPLPGGVTAVGDGEKDGAYHLFDARTGRPLWSTDLTAPGTDTLIVATSAVAGGRIFVGTMDVASSAATWPGNYQQPASGRLVALDAASGRLLWSDALYAAVAAAPVAGAGEVIAVEADGVLFSADAASGRIGWQAQAPGQIWNAEAGLAAAGSTVLVPLANPGGVAAYEPPPAAAGHGPTPHGG